MNKSGAWDQESRMSPELFPHLDPLRADQRSICVIEFGPQSYLVLPQTPTGALLSGSFS